MTTDESVVAGVNKRLDLDQYPEIMLRLATMEQTWIDVVAVVGCMILCPTSWTLEAA
jgi:hypothetical protein